jgi:RNA polymerase sigma factor, sigma-70 family
MGAMNFENIYNRFYRELFCYAHQLTECKFRSEDLVHEAFVRFFEVCKNGTQIQNSRAWLYKVLLNLHKTHQTTEKRRSEKLQTVDKTESSDEDLHDQFSNREKEQIVSKMLFELPERDKNIIILYRRGLSYDEIAEVLEMNKTSVGTTLARAIEKLQNNLKTNYHELFE